RQAPPRTRPDGTVPRAWLVSSRRDAFSARRTWGQAHLTPRPRPGPAPAPPCLTWIYNKQYDGAGMGTVHRPAGHAGVRPGRGAGERPPTPALCLRLLPAHLAGAPRRVPPRGGPGYRAAHRRPGQPRGVAGLGGGRHRTRGLDPRLERHAEDPCDAVGLLHGP